MNSNTSREAFKSSPICADANFAMTNGVYANPTVNRMWMGWQASREAIADEQAQAVEPFICGFDVTTGNCTSSPCCYTQSATGERAELIARQRSVQEIGVNAEMRELAKATADMLESDAKAQQVAVPAGFALVPIEPTPAMSAAGFCVNEAEHDPAGVYRAMLAAAQGAKK